MDIATATQAGQLAAEINTANAQVALINQLLTDNAYVTGGTLSVADPMKLDQNSNASVFSQTIQQLTVSESATVFNAMLTILNARLSTWNTTLTGLV